jgi:hypothetical protein
MLKICIEVNDVLHMINRLVERETDLIKGFRKRQSNLPELRTCRIIIDTTTRLVSLELLGKNVLNEPLDTL